MNKTFWERVSIGSEDECWPWTCHKDRYGYGMYRVPKSKRKFMGAHRVAYELSKGEIPPGLFVLHSCDNPACCNPAHLHLGTNRDNVIESLIRRRANNGNHKILSLEDVAAIRKMRWYENKPIQELADLYQYSPQTIRDIVYMRTWKSIHPICKEPATHFVLSAHGGYFIPLCPAHKDMFDRDPRPISELGQRDFPGCSFVK